jgi:hypothetical protein
MAKQEETILLTLCHSSSLCGFSVVFAMSMPSCETSDFTLVCVWWSEMKVFLSDSFILFVTHWQAPRGVGCGE